MQTNEHSAKASANVFLLFGNREEVPITPMKIIKLIYIAHGHYLAKKDSPLFSERVEAWDYGPVIPSLYHEFKIYGAFPIDSFAKERKGILMKTPFALGGGVFQFLGKVWNKYRNEDAIELANKTHEEGTPWHTTRYSIEYQHNRNIIKNSLIREYYLEEFGKGYFG